MKSVHAIQVLWPLPSRCWCCCLQLCDRSQPSLLLHFRCFQKRISCIFARSWGTRKAQAGLFESVIDPKMQMQGIASGGEMLVKLSAFLVNSAPPPLNKKANGIGGDHRKKRTMEEDSPLLLKEDIKTADVRARVGTVAGSLLLALLAAICFSSMSFCVAMASTSLPPLQLVFINGVCMFVASVMLLLLLKRERTYELCPTKKLRLIITR